MGTIYLIRHGQASFGKSKEEYDKLSPIGVRQSQMLAEYFKRIEKRFDAVYCGDLHRQQQTAHELIERYRKDGLEISDIVISRAFDEFDAFNVWDHHAPLATSEDTSLEEDMKNALTDGKAFQRVFDIILRRWFSGEYDPPGCIKWLDFRKQVVEGLEKIVETQGPDDHIAVFTSGGVIAAALKHSLGLDDEKTVEILWRILNASVTRLQYRSNVFTPYSFNEVSHLELAVSPGLLTLR